MSNLWILSPVLAAWPAGIILLIWSFAEHLAPMGKKEGGETLRGGQKPERTGQTLGRMGQNPKRTGQKPGSTEQKLGRTEQNPERTEQKPGSTEQKLERTGRKRGKAEQNTGKPGQKLADILAIGALLAAAVAALCVAWSGERSVTLFYLMEDIPIYFQVDGIGRWFASLVTAVWVPVGIYSVLYMRREGEEKRFFGFYLLLYGVLICLDFAGNLVTMYVFYELMTLASFPLVLHSGSREAIMAALKYLFYSLCGAYMGLFGIYYLHGLCGDLTFAPGGILHRHMIQGQERFLLAAVMVMLIGFGAKAGMFPLHAWLPTAHPVAPSPASAVLSGIIVKSGVLAVIRVVYYIVGADFLRGTWVQYTWTALALITIFMGSLLAFREPVLKKRLAYSTVSNLSYILFGLAALSPAGFTGALLHAAFHGVVKCGLFLTAGIFLFCYGKTKVGELAGIGREMPVVLWCYTLLSLALIGIPPTCGFVSKWYLALGALEADLGPWGYGGVIVLLVSALLTAGYLLPIVTKGFFPGVSGQGQTLRSGRTAAMGQKSTADGAESPGSVADGAKRSESADAAARCREPGAAMLVPLLILAALALAAGLFPNALTEYANKIAIQVLG